MAHVGCTVDGQRPKGKQGTRFTDAVLGVAAGRMGHEDVRRAPALRLWSLQKWGDVHGWDSGARVADAAA